MAITGTGAPRLRRARQPRPDTDPGRASAMTLTPRPSRNSAMFGRASTSRRHAARRRAATCSASSGLRTEIGQPAGSAHRSAATPTSSSISRHRSTAASTRLRMAASPRRLVRRFLRILNALQPHLAATAQIALGNAKGPAERAHHRRTRLHLVALVFADGLRRHHAPYGTGQVAQRHPGSGWRRRQSPTDCFAAGHIGLQNIEPMRFV